MLASKENAKKALSILDQAKKRNGTNRIEFVREFLEAAEKKLPSEAAYAKDAKRKRTGKKVTAS